MTSQSRSQVRCPICDSSFEIAEVLEEIIPSVEIVDSATTLAQQAPTKAPTPERINAIDTPELFHVSKDDYKPKTEKKNGRFVVPELLSKGIKKKKRKGTRRRSRKQESDPRVVAGLAKLKQNSAKTSLSGEIESKGDSKKGKKRSAPNKSRNSRSEKNRNHKTGSSVSIMTAVSKVRSFGDFVNLLKPKSAGALSQSKKFRVLDLEKPGSKIEYIMIGIGMLLAIPMLHLMMWWFVGIDPLGLAKPTSYVVPFVVPNEMKAVVAENVDQEIEAIAETNETTRNQFQSTSSSQRFDGKLPKPKLDPSSVHVGN